MAFKTEEERLAYEASMQKLYANDRARYQGNHKPVRAQTAQTTQITSILKDILVANALIRISPFLVGGAVLFGAFAISDLNRSVDQSVATPAPIGEVKEEVDATPCGLLSDELLSKADDVSRYYSGVGGNSEEYYRLRNEADALKQKGIDMGCPNVERVRY
jgi:hypothetical protein